MFSMKEIVIDYGGKILLGKTQGKQNIFRTKRLGYLING